MPANDRQNPPALPTASPAPTAPSGPAGGWTGPDFPFQDLFGNPHKLSEMAGRVVLIDFWASWCLPCRKSFPFLDRLQSKYPPTDFGVVAVTLETEPEEVMSFVKGFPGMRFLIGRDPSGKSAELMQVEAMPTSFLLGRDGKELGRFEGGGEETHARLEKAVAAAVTGVTATLADPAGKTSAGPKGNLKAWERGHLADPIMSLDGDALKQSMREHIHASKEAAAGNGGVAGGGCGCN